MARLDIEIQRKIAQDLFQICFPLKTSNISDNKRQQTTTVDNKRLINGLVLTRVASLQRII